MKKSELDELAVLKVLARMDVEQWAQRRARLLAKLEEMEYVEIDDEEMVRGEDV